MSVLPDPSIAAYSHLNYALHGLRRGINGRRQLTRLPITPDVLSKILRLRLAHHATWTTLCCGLHFALDSFGFMQSGGFTCQFYSRLA